jgi:hypothetical protein
MPHDPYIFGARGQSVTYPSTADDVVRLWDARPNPGPAAAYKLADTLHAADISLAADEVQYLEQGRD